MRILVVDDSRAMRLIIRRQLRRAGLGEHTVTEAADGAEALAAVLADRPTLVLSDWNMPAPDGLQLLTELRRRGINVPFGFITSEGTPEMRRRAEEAGAAFVVAKPFGADDLRAAIEEVTVPRV